jgi:tetratricopeptide (TPR) repeat protein
LAHYKEGLKNQSENGPLYFHKGLAHVSLTEFEEGIENFKLAAKHTTQSSGDSELRFRILLNWGINLRRVGRLAESIDQLKKAIELQP